MGVTTRPVHSLEEVSLVSLWLKLQTHQLFSFAFFFGGVQCTMNCNLSEKEVPNIGVLVLFVNSFYAEMQVIMVTCNTDFEVKNAQKPRTM